MKASQSNNWLLVAAVLGLTITPLVLLRGAEFGGADSRAAVAITEIKPTYKPWFQPLFEPASSEIASLLFASQAALGAGVLGYVIGFYKGRSQSSNSQNRPK